VGVFLWRIVAAAIVDRRLQQVTARGFIQEGLPNRGGLRLCVMLLLLRSWIATRNRSPPGTLPKKASPSGEAFVFVSFLSRGVAVAIVGRDPQQVTARGLIPNNPHRKRWGVFGRLHEPQRLE